LAVGRWERRSGSSPNDQRPPPSVPFEHTNRLILASASPQRRAILAQIGVPFEVRPAHVDEVGGGDPAVAALENARRKARAVAGDLVLGVDTVVALDGRIYGKPGDEGEARAMLAALSGRTHEVWSGIHLTGTGEAVERTAVTFRQIGAELTAWYTATGEWRGRAGGYAIQGRGAVLVTRIEGDYLNVVGLPVARLVDLLGKAGFPGFFA
jgi:septum formation protein